MQKTKCIKCGACEHVDSNTARCNKFSCPIPVNIHNEFLKCSKCEDNLGVENEGTSKT